MADPFLVTMVNPIKNLKYYFGSRFFIHGTIIFKIRIQVPVLIKLCHQVELLFIFKHIINLENIRVRYLKQCLCFLFEFLIILSLGPLFLNHLNSSNDVFTVLGSIFDCALMHLAERSFSERLPHQIHFIE